MTKFKKELFTFDGLFLMYRSQADSIANNFVARFKHVKDQNSVKKFLIENFTVEEYFDRLNKNEAPLQILRSKGYLQPHIKKWLKEGGYTVDTDGYDKFVKDQSLRALNKINQ